MKMFKHIESWVKFAAISCFSIKGLSRNLQLNPVKVSFEDYCTDYISLITYVFAQRKADWGFKFAWAYKQNQIHVSFCCTDHIFY